MSNEEKVHIPFDLFVHDAIKNNPGITVLELAQHFSLLLSASASKDDVIRETFSVVADLVNDEVWVDSQGRLFETYEVGIKYQSNNAVVFKIDPNVRVRGNRTYVDKSDLLKGELDDVYVGQKVDVVETESRLRGVAVVYEIDAKSQLIILDIVWKDLKFDSSVI